MAWNRPSEAPKVAPKKSPSKMRGIVAGLVVVALASVCVFMFMGKGDAPAKKVEKKPTKIKEVTPAPAPKPIDPKKARIEKIKKMVEARGGVKNLTAEDKREILAAVDGERKPVKPPTVAPVHGNPYATATDQVLAMAISAGDQIPPLPGIEKDMEKDMYESLQKPIVINEDDDEKTKEMKEAVIAARAEIQERLKNGESIRDVLESHREMVNGNTQLRNDVAKTAREYLEAGDTEGMETYLKKANEMLEEMGARPVERPLTREERIEQLKAMKEKQ